MLTTTFFAALIAGGVMAGMPLLFAGLGEMVSERAGVLNIGLEGMMLVGGYAGFVAAFYGHSAWLGLAVGSVAGVVAAGVVVVLCVWSRLDQIVVGIGLLLVAEGVTSALQRSQFGTTYPRLDAVPKLSLPLLAKVPVVGPGLFDQPLVVYLGFALVALVWWVLRSTRMGLEVRAAGEKPEALDVAGGSVVTVRTAAVLLAGAGAGLGGAYMAIVGAGIFVPYMTHGAGFVAIVIAMMSRGKAVWVLIGALLFGMSVSLVTALQLVGVDISQDVVNMLPFLAVIAALVVFARRAYLPAALGRPYARGSR